MLTEFVRKYIYVTPKSIGTFVLVNYGITSTSLQLLMVSSFIHSFINTKTIYYNVPSDIMVLYVQMLAGPSSEELQSRPVERVAPGSSQFEEGW